MNKFKVYILLYLISVSVRTEVSVNINENNLLLPTEVDSWTRKIFNSTNFSFDPYIECRRVSQLPGHTLLCINLGPATSMLKILGPVSIYAEGNFGYSKGSLVSRTEMKEKAEVLGIDLFGYNLKGEDIKSFLLQTKNSCELDKDNCLSQPEVLFFNNIQKYLQEDFTLITSTLFPMIYGDKHKSVISHEALHVLFFRDFEYRARVESFWQQKVKDIDKANIKEAFKDIYDTNEEYVIINEFQAHILQGDEGSTLLKEYNNLYRKQLMDYLGELTPTSFQFE